MDKGLSWSSSLPAYFRVQNPIPLLHSIQCRSAACNACSRATHRNRVLAWSAIRKTLPVRCPRSEEHTSELQSHLNLVCRLLLENKTGLMYFLTPLVLAQCLADPS